MNKKQRKSWQRARMRGKGFFVLIYGELFIGLILLVIMDMIYYVFFRHMFTPISLLANFFLCSLVGMFIGNRRWNINELKFFNSACSKRISSLKKSDLN